MDKQILRYAENDRQNAKENDVSLNPFSTPRARLLWTQGFAGTRPADLIEGSQNWRYWVRGLIAYQLACADK